MQIGPVIWGGGSSHTHIHTEIGLCSQQYTGDAKCPKFKQQYTITSKRYEIGCHLLLITNRKSHTVFQLVPTSVILNDPEGGNTLFHRIR